MNPERKSCGFKNIRIRVDEALGLSRVPPHERLLNGAITSVRWRLAFVLKEPIGNLLLSACQVDSCQFRLPCALKYARFYEKIGF